MKLGLKFVRSSSSGKARLYEDGKGARQWVPVSLISSCVKHPPAMEGQLSRHEVELPDWWIDQNPWPKTKQKELVI